jgi:hypothetical protein
MSETKTICKGCKVETEPDLFNKAENLKNILDALSELGFTPDSDFIEFVKPKLAGLCVLCGETEVIKTALLSVVVDKIDEKETKECIVNLLNAFSFLAQESMWLACKRAVHSEIVRSKRKLNARTAWRLFMVLCNIRGQHPHVEEAEAGLMVALRKYGYSMGDLAFIFDRSKDTVSRHVGVGGFR